MKCATLHCRKRRAKGRKVCAACQMRRVRRRNPIKAQYWRLRDSARKRGINFCLPFWYFEIFALQCDFVTLTGNTAQSLTVDRKENLLGYVMGNIKPMTRSENCIKQAKFDQRRMEKGFAWRG